MKSYEKLTPEGTRDFLFEESDALRRIERGLSELFKEKGYKKVITPTVEFFDVFNRESAGTLPENLYSMTDAYGSHGHTSHVIGRFGAADCCIDSRISITGRNFKHKCGRQFTCTV